MVNGQAGHTPPCPIAGFPAPERLEARAVPPKDAIRLNNAGRTEQARPELGHPYQQRPVTAAQHSDFVYTYLSLPETSSG